MMGKVMGKKVRGEQIIKVIRRLELILRAVWSLRRDFSIKAQRTKGRKALSMEACFQQRHSARGVEEGTVAPVPSDFWFIPPLRKLKFLRKPAAA